MGVYLVSVGAKDWFKGSGDEEEDGWVHVSSALNEELGRRGLPAYESVPEDVEFVRGSGQRFEEKLIPSMDGFVALCEAHLSAEEVAVLCGWSVLVPFSLDEPILLPVGSGYTDETLVAGAPQMLALAERLAEAVDLPAETPAMCDNLDLTLWFMDGPARELAASRPGPWSADLDAAFYVALYLRAAQHSLRRGCPIVYT
ncbi:hypothetical protein [Streptomyces neyagawaensis]|uniref:hypothetical protein n=1 Tax=Streptomyces neyagawaensis TaxID=42238 RepID=UPI0006E39C3A|nr:hypothetical protein [Streptomyces neyagawaensis]MCL6734626.1 hypothetical protein [Streptomyces neyagawaensis]MDE1682211.1 hypothetical protein [Streptomyces neyagawaensis]